MTTPATPRFGAVADLIGGQPDELSAIIAARQQPAPSNETPEVATPAAPVRPQATAPRAAKTAKAPATPRGSMPTAGATFIYPGVPDHVRHAAPQLARDAKRSVGDLVVLGTQLDLPYGLADVDDHHDLPIGKPRAAEPNLTTMQVRVTAAQRAWLEEKAAEQGAVSLRQYAGAALTAYVEAHAPTTAQ